MKTIEKIGSYISHVQREGEDECANKDFKIKDGDVYWTIKLANGFYFDVKTQAEAEIISRLIKIEQMLKSIKAKKRK